MNSKRNVFYVALAIFACFSFASQTTAETIGTGKGPVIAVRLLELKADVDTTEFEKFVREEFNPAMQGTMPGVKEFIAKSDRGTDVGSYALFTIFDSQIVRDTMLPGEGQGLAEWMNEIMKKKGLWSRWNTLKKRFLVEGSTRKYNDYVVLR